MKPQLHCFALLVLVAMPLCGQASKVIPKTAPTVPPKALPKGPLKNGPRLTAPRGDVERLLAMPPEQRERVLEKLPSRQQEALRKRFEQFDQRPPEERARLLQMWKQFESLPPEKREILNHQMQAFNALPEDRRVVLRRTLNSLARLTPEEREKRLESEPFQSRFSATELKMLSDLAENYPLGRK